MSDNAIFVSVAAALSAIVGGYALMLKRRSNGHAKDKPEDEIVTNIALIERMDIDLPRNWRDWVDGRIEHKGKNVRMVFALIASDIEHGHHDRALRVAKMAAEEGE